MYMSCKARAYILLEFIEVANVQEELSTNTCGIIYFVKGACCFVTVIITVNIYLCRQLN